MTTTSLNKVSIRLESGGHSFSGAELRAVVDGGHEAVEVVVLTPKTTLVPADLFDAKSAADYLVAVGLAPNNAECVVCTKPINGAVAVMAINQECNAALHGVGFASISYATPLLCGDAVEQGSVLHLEGGLLYVRVYNAGLRFAEVMECQCDADMLYYLTQINEVYNTYDMCARATGDTKSLQRVTKRLFKELICE